MLKRATTYFLAFAVILGVTLQIAGPASAAAGTPGMEMAAMNMGSGCNPLAPPCNGATPDCMDSMGCLVNAAAPVAPLMASVPLLWGAVSYFSLNAMPNSVSVKPEHSPPIPHA